MASKLQLRTKIRAVGNIKQITRAMQLVAATKMRKSQEVALRARPYAKHALSLLFRLSHFSEDQIQQGTLWKKRTEGKICLVVVTSDKGLSGTFNSTILKSAFELYQKELSEGEDVEIVAVGKKARDFFKKRGAAVVAEFFKFSDIVTLSEVTPLADWILNSYKKDMYKEVVFCSMQFVSALIQKPDVNSILPIVSEELRKIVNDILPKTGKYASFEKLEENGNNVSYITEPSAKEILEGLSRDLVRIEILHLIFESNASEHSARMLAMKNATENAENLVESLNLQLNKARQAAITQELTEISTAKEALTSQ